MSQLPLELEKNGLTGITLENKLIHFDALLNYLDFLAFLRQKEY